MSFRPVILTINTCELSYDCGFPASTFVGSVRNGSLAIDGADLNLSHLVDGKCFLNEVLAG